MYIYAYFLVYCTNQKGLRYMGKSLKGKELGKGISQRKEDAINNLRTDNERKNSKKILIIRRKLFMLDIL